MPRTKIQTIQAATTALIEQGDLSRVAEFFAPDYVAHLTGSEMTGGHAALRKVMELYHRAFTELRVEIEVLVTSRDRIAWQRTFRGVQSGPFKGFPATGRALVWRDMVTSRFVDGLIAEEWVLTDLAEQLLMARKR